MDQPVYVIKSVESVWTYKYNGKIYDVLKKVVWILVILFIISSLFFHKNTFMELAFGTRLLLIIMSVIILGTAYATEKTPSPFEIRFYEDYMVVYREKYYYDRNLSRKEYDKFFYKDTIFMAWLNGNIGIIERMEHFQKDQTDIKRLKACAVFTLQS